MHLETVGCERFGEVEGDIGARDMDQRSLRRIEAATYLLGQGRAIACRRGDGGESQPLGRGGRRVADGEDRFAALLAGVGQRARAVGAGQQHGLARCQRREEVGGRTQDFQPEQRRDDRKVATLDQRRSQRGRLAFGSGDEHAHALFVARIQLPLPRLGGEARRRAESVRIPPHPDSPPGGEAFEE